ncbi:MAG: spore coat protein [Clostridiales bacterium]|jgi:spore coat protein CotF|nr:spore coat protein [Bacillota bacterium]NLK04375.1 spore coat protein [Clostridiales bacterium]
MITNVTLSTKEQLLLQDQKTHEEQCILKYDNYANLAVDSQLKTIFRNIAQKEREHLQTINQLLNGQVPSMAGQSSQQQTGQQQTGQNTGSMPMSQQASIDQSPNNPFKASDKDMCIDMLSTEKYVSSTYDTTIFECKSAQVRDVLNHIQKEEQKHGEQIFSYMQSKGMY